ncbi:MAG: hypothetical protein H0T89_25555 [Deltaproteobacteria bacterium]|nr:hypothetical protein [Deltaproteobacteria bacterium]
MPTGNDAASWARAGKGKGKGKGKRKRMRMRMRMDMVERLSNLVAIFDNPALDFRGNRAEGERGVSSSRLGALCSGSSSCERSRGIFALFRRCL